MQNNDFSYLEPHIVWKHFQTLCEIPRPSKQEHQLRQHLIKWATQLGLSTQVDQIGNLIIRKPATQGMETKVGVILQGHLDMVTQANRQTNHDFLKDPIRPVFKDGWLIAENTTLGADNGIGVALALAVLESQDIVHGPIEVLLTIDEEAGMSGARNLEPNLLTGQWLLNIDTEEWGQLYLGCAASLDVEIYQATAVCRPPQDLQYFDIQLTGLKGGHSGVDIHLGRGNANVILSQFLSQYLNEFQGHLVKFSGGTARNALPREAIATIGIPEKYTHALKQCLQDFEDIWRKKLKNVDDHLTLEIQRHLQPVQHIIDPQQQYDLIQALANCPFGVASMSQTLPDVVQTSNNIGVVRLDTEQAQIQIMVRAMANEDVKNFAVQIQQHFAKFSINAQLSHLVSGWTPDPQSAALKCLEQAYQKAFDIHPELKVIHAGLECGIIAEHYPGLQMVSFGPDIQGAHAPGERVKVDTVAKCWKLLTTALALVK
ncbi:aminoacyl-histidine dipeptidase [Acinetobacter qingfengensis]|uniref:Cytosol non-specific dipeptidase n=1 Tax=Acinetobacter qingfengensis TaxID=1262585 RepID=A0A1E7QWS8_9GAMM|nr:aminoacyl-histidine dipeptidase [Acinetobacter qingfengensis]KAA8731241.1 aminoacyl-histidine dipeptidase [Acinetobacter qingfengensis]OEY91511.1 aminoacyl-histidine dipeptidase [Acinetobacter qingfengensis]